MFNLTGGKLGIILLVALVVLGPDKLPQAVRNMARLYGELRRMSDGFQSEIRNALDEPMRHGRDTVDMAKTGFTSDEAGPPAASGPPESEHDSAPPPDGNQIAVSSAEEATGDHVWTGDESTLKASRPVSSGPGCSAEPSGPRTGDPA